jgi:hypothetical protein
MSQEYRGRFLAGVYGSSLKSLTELGSSIQTGNFHREGSEIVYANGKRMSLTEAKGLMENVENVGIISLNETNQAFRAMKAAEKQNAHVMTEISRV